MKDDPANELRAAERLKWQVGYAAATADMERGVFGEHRPGDIWPDWVYEARSAITHQNAKLPWLPDLLRILGWQGGTVHQALNAVARLVESDKARALTTESAT